MLMSYYIGTQRIKPSDVFVIEVDAIPEDAIRSCWKNAQIAGGQHPSSETESSKTSGMRVIALRCSIALSCFFADCDTRTCS